MSMFPSQESLVSPFPFISVFYHQWITLILTRQFYGSSVNMVIEDCSIRNQSSLNSCPETHSTSHAFIEKPIVFPHCFSFYSFHNIQDVWCVLFLALSFIKNYNVLCMWETGDRIGARENKQFLPIIVHYVMTSEKGNILVSSKWFQWTDFKIR